MTDREQEIIKKLNHPLYTVEFLEEWKDRKDNIFANAPEALQVMGAKGFYDAVCRMAQGKSNWIPVEEQIPDDDTDMIVCKSDGIIDIAFWNGDAWMSLDSNYILNVLAWMPLPEPYNPQN